MTDKLENSASKAGETAVFAAIALALHLFRTEGIHDTESGRITIRRQDSRWGDKFLNFRKVPVRK